MNKIWALLWLPTLLCMACSTEQPADKALAQQLLDSLQKVHAPDRRLNYWQFELKETAQGLQLLGATSEPEALNDLQKVFANHLPALRLQLRSLPDSVIGETPLGLVNLSVCNLRKEPKHAAELVTQALLGTPVRLLDKQRGWYLVQTPDRYLGWVDGSSITPKSRPEMAQWRLLKKVLFTPQYGFVYPEADASAAPLSDIVAANLLAVVDSVGDFYQVQFPDGRRGYLPRNACRDADIWQNSKAPLADDLVRTARQFLGIPYLWGGASVKAIDCSGFTKTVFLLHGIVLQRDASQQTLFGELVDTQKDFSQLQAGDLLFFGRAASDSLPERITHVGLYIGDTEFIHASGLVRINSIDSTRPNFEPDYMQSFVRARRYLGHEGQAGIEWVRQNGFYHNVFNKP